MKEKQRSVGRWRPTPALAIAILALFVALGGTASALKGKFSVKKGDIAPKAVKTWNLGGKAVTNHKLAGNSVSAGKIKDYAVGPYKLHLGRAVGTNDEASTTSQVPVDLNGPTASVKAPAGSTIQVQVQAAMRSTAKNTSSVYLYAPGLLPKAQRMLESGSNAKFQYRFSTPGTSSSGADKGVTNVSRGGWITIPVSSAGIKTFSLRYETSGGTAIFKDRRISLNVIR